MNKGIIVVQYKQIKTTIYNDIVKNSRIEKIYMLKFE